MFTAKKFSTVFGVSLSNRLTSIFPMTVCIWTVVALAIKAVDKSPMPSSTGVITRIDNFCTHLAFMDIINLVESEKIKAGGATRRLRY